MQFVMKANVSITTYIHFCECESSSGAKCFYSVLSSRLEFDQIDCDVCWLCLVARSSGPGLLLNYSIKLKTIFNVEDW